MQTDYQRSLAARAELVFANRAIVEAVNAHNCRVIALRVRGSEAPAYRNALAEIEAATVLSARQAALASERRGAA